MIKVKFNYNFDFGDVNCFISGKIFAKGTLIFYLDDNVWQPVSPEEAIKRGFIISMEDFKRISDNLDDLEEYRQMYGSL